MSTKTSSKIHKFAVAVRAELADLPETEVISLTEGLEADLTERLAEEGYGFEFESPSEYAAELREAAGITPKAAKRKTFSGADLTQNIESWFRKSTLGTALIDFGVSVRPVWWVLRAAVAWYVFVGFLYSFMDGLVLLPILVFLSIQWGRKKWFTNKFFAAILLPLNLMAIVLLVPAQAMLVQKVNNYAYAEQILREMPSSEGLRYNGEQITQLRAFDKEGREIDGLTFKDQREIPIEIPPTEVAYFLMPEILGMPYTGALEALKQAGIPAVDFVYLDGASASNGVVVEVNPPSAGDMVTEFDVVTVTIGTTFN